MVLVAVLVNICVSVVVNIFVYVLGLMYPVGVVASVGLRTLEIVPSKKVVVHPLVGGENNDNIGPEPDKETELLVGEDSTGAIPASSRARISVPSRLQNYKCQMGSIES